MKIYDYSGRANISGDRIHQARTAQAYPKMSLPPRCRSMVLVLGERQSAALRPATASLPIMSLPSSPAFSVFPSYGSPAIWNRKNNSGTANRL